MKHLKLLKNRSKSYDYFQMMPTSKVLSNHKILRVLIHSFAWCSVSPSEDASTIGKKLTEEEKSTFKVQAFVREYINDVGSWLSSLELSCEHQPLYGFGISTPTSMLSVNPLKAPSKNHQRQLHMYRIARVSHCFLSSVALISLDSVFFLTFILWTQFLNL